MPILITKDRAAGHPGILPEMIVVVARIVTCKFAEFFRKFPQK